MGMPYDRARQAGCRGEILRCIPRALSAAVRNHDFATSQHTVMLRPRERRSVQVRLKVHVSDNLRDEFFWVIEPAA